MPSLPEPASHYTDAVRAGDLLFVSGCLGVDGGGRLVEGGTVAQAQQVFANLATVLAAGGASWADVVKMTTFLTEIGDRPLIDPLRRELFGGTRPASTLVEVSLLAIPGATIEVEVVALVPGA